VRLRSLILLLFLGGGVQAADVVTVAVASNFKSTATQLASRFLEESGNAVRLSSGSTGKLYTQIVNGAPFDVFLAADAERPTLLEEGGFAVQGSRFTYATGSLVLFSTRVTDCMAALKDGSAGFVAIANPATSPYGKAARQFLAGENLLEVVSARTVYGENITQAWQFAFTGNAVVGFAARAQMHLAPGEPTCSYEIPGSTHDPLQQQAVLLDADNKAARAFLEFLRSAIAGEIIRQDGYQVSE
jgi:molybdate transport system substrate-binding protein